MGLAAGVVILARGLNVSLPLSEHRAYLCGSLNCLWVSREYEYFVTLSWIYAYNQMPFLCNGVIILFEKLVYGLVRIRASSGIIRA